MINNLNIPKDKIVFVPLGGVGEIGMNFYVYGYKGKWLIVDIGIGFAKETEPGVDILMADPTFITERKKDVVGIILTHAHEDHLGALARVWPDLGCPVYTTPFTASFLQSKLVEANLLGVTPVDIVKQGERISIEPFDVEFIAVSHSTPQACALAIRTDAGNILHTGDWKFEEPLLGKPTDFEALKRFGDEGVLAMVCDSTNILSDKRNGSEAQVREELIRLFSEFDCKIAAACFASNVERVESIALAAQANGRKVVLVGRSLWRMESAARSCGYLKGLDDFLEAEDADYLPDNKVLYICTGSQGEARAALSRIASGTHRYVKLEPDDVVIFSSRVIPGNEKSILDLQNKLCLLGVDIVTEKEAPIHVSGHPSRDEMEKMYKMIRPKIAIPVHGEARHLSEHEWLAEEMEVEKIEVIENGQLIVLSDDDRPIKTIGDVHTGCIAIDGKRTIDFDSPALKTRRKILHNCSAVVTLILNADGGLVSNPQISVPGLLDETAEKEELDDVVLGIKEFLDSLSASKKREDDYLIKMIKQTVRKIINDKYGKKPVTDVHLVRI